MKKKTLQEQGCVWRYQCNISVTISSGTAVTAIE
jgi:hypothetical protein